MTANSAGAKANIILMIRRNPAKAHITAKQPITTAYAVLCKGVMAWVFVVSPMKLNDANKQNTPLRKANRERFGIAFQKAALLDQEFKCVPLPCLTAFTSPDTVWKVYFED